MPFNSAPIVTADPVTAAAFTDLAAVQAWDAWFRWRQGDELRDTSIDATWRRVAEAMATVELEAPSVWARRFLACFSSWRLLPDERLITQAGTGSAEWTDNLIMGVNLAVLVRDSLSTSAHFDFASFRETVRTAIRLLENAALIGMRIKPEPVRLSITIIGLADALALLDLPYASEAARDFASEIGHTLHRMCSHKSTPGKYRRSELEGLEWCTVHGTVLEPHPRLALFANHVSDSIEPLADPARPVPIDARVRAIASCGYALQLARQSGSDASMERMRERAKATASDRSAMLVTLAPYFDRVAL